MVEEDQDQVREAKPTDGAAARWQRPLLLVAGSLALALGIIGVFVPLLPTTPFLLLAAACYLRSSPRLHSWLLKNRFLGQYLRHYHEGTGLPLHSKIISLACLWLTIGYSVCYVVQRPWLQVLLLMIALAVTIHIATIRPLRKD